MKEGVVGVPPPGNAPMCTALPGVGVGGTFKKNWLSPPPPFLECGMLLSSLVRSKPLLLYSRFFCTHRALEEEEEETYVGREIEKHGVVVEDTDVVCVEAQAL